ncbi:MAG: DUF1289 domain-containing protein [Steroidobacteraceae bacterium]|jgi:predicted Fe-S protein YdhL (DUF1289 family)|nr:DUF1289 domain-containing protein [Steroidobacteraceae bacterium]
MPPIPSPPTDFAGTAGSVASPCIKVCTLDEQQVCMGCGRTLTEIVQWSALSAEQQRAVCVAAERRISRRRAGP